MERLLSRGRNQRFSIEFLEYNAFNPFLAVSALLLAVVALVFSSFAACVASLAMEVATETDPFNIAIASNRVLICPQLQMKCLPTFAW